MEVKDCSIKIKGKGIFVTKNYKVGELIMIDNSWVWKTNIYVEYSNSSNLVQYSDRPWYSLYKGWKENSGQDHVTKRLINSCLSKDYKSILNLSKTNNSGKFYKKYGNPNAKKIEEVLTSNVFNFTCLPLIDYVLLKQGDNNMDSGQGLYPIASRINHSCDPNCAYFATPQQIVIHTIKDIQAGDEITVYYHDLQSLWFKCKCGYCDNITTTTTTNTTTNTNTGRDIGTSVSVNENWAMLLLTLKSIVGKQGKELVDTLILGRDQLVINNYYLDNIVINIIIELYINIGCSYTNINLPFDHEYFDKLFINHKHLFTNEVRNYIITLCYMFDKNFHDLDLDTIMTKMLNVNV